MRELLEQFHFEHRQGSEEKLFHILMHPFTLHALARGNTLKVFVTWTWKADCFRVFEPMSPQSSSPLQHVTRKGAIFFVACIVFGRRKGMRPGRIGPFQSHPLAKSQTLDCMPEMSSSSGASSSSLQACAALSHGLCLVRRMRAS